MFPWSSVVSWLELCCPHRVTWSQQRSWDASSRSETSLPSSSLLLSVSLNAIMWLIWPWCCVSFVLFTVTLLNGKCVSVWCCRFPRVPDICAVWTHHPAGANSHTRHYEGTDYSCVLSLFFAFLCLAPVSVSFDSYFLPVYDGCTRAVSNLASRVSAHTVDRLCWPRSGQRILLRPGQSCASSWHHLQRGQWLPLMLVLASVLLFRQRRI